MLKYFFKSKQFQQKRGALLVKLDQTYWSNHKYMKHKERRMIFTHELQYIHFCTLGNSLYKVDKSTKGFDIVYNSMIILECYILPLKLHIAWDKHNYNAKIIQNKKFQWNNEIQGRSTCSKNWRFFVLIYTYSIFECQLIKSCSTKIYWIAH